MEHHLFPRLAFPAACPVHGRTAARLGAAPWWHDHWGVWGALGDLAVDAVLVVCAIGGERGERTYLVKQGSDLGGNVDVAGAQHGRG